MKKWLSIVVFGAITSIATAKTPASALDETVVKTLPLASEAYRIEDEDGNLISEKNSHKIHSIASLTKVMTAYVLSKKDIDWMDEVTITKDDVDTLKNSSSRLQVGTRLSKHELLSLALMSSENRATHALARTSDTSVDAFVSKMNANARKLGMKDTSYADPTGLNPQNRSTATDLIKLMKSSAENTLIKMHSTNEGREVDSNKGVLVYRNTNPLMRTHNNIVLTKTGYTKEAGHCLMMAMTLQGKKYYMVFLNSPGKQDRFKDALKTESYLKTNYVASN